jgi:dihydrodipicolinate synthase/N-acetylneuraminate lyase
MSAAPGGIVCPIATPLTDEEQLDVPALEALLDRITPHLDGVFALGSSGEFALLSARTAEALVDCVLERVAGRLPVYVGVGDTGTRRAIDNVRRLARPGVDYFVVCSSYYYPITDQPALVRHFLEVAEASPVPVVIYNIPQNTATALAPDAAAPLAEHPNVAGLKDSWGDMFGFQEFLALRSPGFSVMQGREQLAATSLWLGADGVISALANLFPQLLDGLRDAIAAGDQASALRAQRQVTQIAAIFDQGYWLSALKGALAELGIGSGRMAAPLPAASADQRRTIAQMLAATHDQLDAAPHG